MISTLDLPPGAKPVHNKLGMFLVLTTQEKEQYKLWKIYQRHDGQFWLYFGSGIKRKVDEVCPGYQILALSW